MILRLLLSEPDQARPGGGPAGGGVHVGEAGQEKEPDGLQCLTDRHRSRHPLLHLLPHAPGGPHLLRSPQLYDPQPFLRLLVRNFPHQVKITKLE